ncbi:MAG TPA: hypothetical protein VFV57_04910 [Limnobacter sp.]|nr:hypothetical protein [Limnobacter sp.]
MKTRLLATVGRLGKNIPLDVQTVQALLNVVHRQKNQAVIPITGRCDELTLNVLEGFQSQVYKSRPRPWPMVHFRCPTHAALQAALDGVVTPLALERPAQGLLTWESEGHEGGPFHSRLLHVPSKFSGLTIGRGYDCSQKTAGTILCDLIDSGFDVQLAHTLAGASGLRGDAAEAFVIGQDLLDHQITPEQQLKLFKKTYAFIRDYMIRVSKSAKDAEGLSEVDWQKTDPLILDVLVDLTYRGDYTTTTRKVIGRFVADNDFKGLCDVLKDRRAWSKVPVDRFRKRVGFCESNL